MTFPVFSPGDVLNASDMNAVGLWLIKTQTIGTTVSSVTVSDAFSADYDYYHVVTSGGVASTSLTLLLTLGSTTTGYRFSATGHRYDTGASTSDFSASATSFGRAGVGTTDSLSGSWWLQNPFNTKYTVYRTQQIPLADNQGPLTGGGFLGDTTSYTAFTLTTSTGTITGGTIRVYGYRN